MNKRFRLDLENREDLSKLLKIYKEKGDIETRNKIVEKCYPMVDYILNIDKFKDFQSNRDILASYGYEGLIMGVMKNESEDIKTFIINTYRSIYNYLMHGISEVTGLSANFFWKLRDASEERESLFGENIEDNLIIVDKILNDLIRDKKLGKEFKDVCYSKVLLSPVQVESIEDNLVDPNLAVRKDMDYEIFVEQLHSYLMYLMDTYCTDNQKDALMKRYGFCGEPLTYDAILSTRSREGTRCCIRHGIYNLRRGLRKEQYFLKHNLEANSFCEASELESPCLLKYLNEDDLGFAKRKVRK